MTRVQTQPSSDSSAMSLTALNDFSLVNGGLLNQLWRRTRLSGDALEWTHRRVLVAVLFA